MNPQILTKASYTYSPIIKNGIYIDNVDKYTCVDFDNYGVKCLCTDSKTIHRNKPSFKHQHCKTKKHIEYLENLNKGPIENNDELDVNELRVTQKEIKQLKIQVRREHEILQLEKQRNLTLQNQLKEILIKNEEMILEVSQTKEFVLSVNKEILDIKLKNEKLEQTHKRYDIITQELMKLSGYEIQ